MCAFAIIVRVTRPSNTRRKLAELAETDDLVTLWHVGGARPCRGPALKVPPGFLDAEEPVLREWSPAFGYKQYGVPYHPGALKFFKERNLTPQPLG